VDIPLVWEIWCGGRQIPGRTGPGVTAGTQRVLTSTREEKGSRGSTGTGDKNSVGPVGGLSHLNKKHTHHPAERSAAIEWSDEKLGKMSEVRGRHGRPVT